MPEDVKEKLNRYNDFIDYIERINKALDTVGYNARVELVTFQPKIAVMHGSQAKSGLISLIGSGKINSYNQIWSKGIYAEKSFIVQFSY